MFEPTTLSSKEMRAKRVTRLRRATGKSRQTFAIDHKLSAGTLQNWEAARYGGLSEKGARLLIKAFSKDRVHCSFEWLMYGLGDQPLLQCNENIKAAPSTSKHLNRFEDELAFFYQEYQDGIHLKIQDQAMLPYFKPKQIVAGIKQYGRSIKQHCNGHACIVQLSTCQTQLLRIVKTDESTTKHVKLIHLNNLAASKTSTDEPYLIDFAAPITWIREDNT